MGWLGVQGSSSPTHGSDRQVVDLKFLAAILTASCSVRTAQGIDNKRCRDHDGILATLVRLGLPLWDFPTGDLMLELESNRYRFPSIVSVRMAATALRRCGGSTKVHSTRCPCELPKAALLAITDASAKPIGIGACSTDNPGYPTTDLRLNRVSASSSRENVWHP